MDDSSETNQSRPGRPSKVARLLEEYGLEGLGPELEALWTAEEGRYSLRELADHFNVQLLKSALGKTKLLDGEAENLYRLLTDDAVSGAERTRARRRLEREDIDVEQLEDDFVTYQAIRTYLKSYRGAVYEPDETDPLEREVNNIKKIRGRTAAVIEGKVDQLKQSNELQLGGYRTIVSFQVLCEGCNTRYELTELIEQGGCECNDS